MELIYNDFRELITKSIIEIDDRRCSIEITHFLAIEPANLWFAVHKRDGQPDVIGREVLALSGGGLFIILCISSEAVL